MVKKISFLCALGVTLLYGDCRTFVEPQEDTLVFYDAHSRPVKKAHLGKKIEKLLCLAGDKVAAVTDGTIYIANTAGRLHRKIEVPKTLSFVAVSGRRALYKGKGRFEMYEIAQTGDVTRTTLTVPADETSLFVSFDGSKNPVLFTKRHMRTAKGNESIVPLSRDANGLVYLQTTDGKIFLADSDFFQKPPSEFSGRFYDPQLLARAFKQMSGRHIESVLKYLGPHALPPEAAAAYLAKFTDRAQAARSLTRYANEKTVFEALRRLGWVKIPDLGTHDYKEIRKLHRKVKAFLAEDLNAYVAKGAAVTLSTIYPKKPDQAVKIEAKIAKESFFTLTLPERCEQKDERTITRYRSVGFLLPVAEVAEQHLRRTYRCTLPAAPSTIERTLTDIATPLRLSFERPLVQSRELVTTHFVKELSRKPTAFGKLLQETFRAEPSQCRKLHDECLKGCRPKENEMRLLPFSESDRTKCEHRCTDADYYCKKGNMDRSIQNYCAARCIGYSIQMYGLSDSDYDKCRKRCLENRRR